MRKALQTVRGKAAFAAIGGAVLLTGVGTAAATGVLGTETAADSSMVTPATATPTPTPTQSPEPVMTVEAAPVEQSETAPSTATVEPVTPTEQPAPTPVPADQDTSGIGTTGLDGNYTPAPPQPVPGGPPVGAPATLPPAQPLPGEPDYQG